MKRPNGYWDLENTLRECRKFLREHGKPLTQRRLNENHFSYLSAAIDDNGGFHEVRNRLGVRMAGKSKERVKGYWTKERVLEEYERVARVLGKSPSAKDLDERGLNGMAWHISNTYGGFFRVREELGIESYRREDHYWTRKRVLSSCSELVAKFGDLPRQTRLAELIRENKQYRGLGSAISGFGGLDKVRRVLGLKQKNKPHDYWSINKIKKEARKIVNTLGYLPATNELTRLGRGDLARAISTYFGFPLLREELGLEVKRRDNYWNDDTVLAECRKIIRKHGDLPSAAKLRELGYSALSSQIERRGYIVVRSKLGLKSRKPQGYWRDEKNAIAEAKKMMKEHGFETLPNSDQLYKLGYASLGASIAKYHGGFYNFREKLGEENNRVEMGRWKDLDFVMEQAREAMRETGYSELPPLNVLSDGGYSSLVNAISNHGGSEIFRRKLKGKSDEEIASFIENNETAKAVASLVTTTENTGDVADILVRLWPARFPSAANLARSLPSAVKHIGHSLHPFSMEKARGIYKKTKSLPVEVRYALDDLLYSIALDQYQIPFNQNPERTLRQLHEFSEERNGVSKLARKVHDYYKQVYDFKIPGHGRLREAS